MIKLSDEMQKFLVASIFGDVFGENENPNEKKIKQACAHAAYLDLARVIKYKHSTSDLEKMKKAEDEQGAVFEKLKKDFISKVEDALVEQDIYKDVSTWMKNVFKDIETKDLFKEEDLTFGMKQKWVNMTRKYLWLFDMCPGEKLQDIPIDSFVIDALFDGDNPILTEEYTRENLKSLINHPKGKRLSEHERPSDWIKPWSRWNKNEYELVQRKVREYCRSRGLIPIKW